MAVKPIVISIVADARKAQKEVSGISGTFKGLGSKIVSFGKTAAKVTGGALAGLAGAALFKGFGRLQGIEQAQAKLRGLGHDGESTKKIMDNALAAVKGTSFGLDEAATAAASAAAAGIKSGEQMETYLKMVGDAAAITGRGFSDMGAIINKVNANTKLSMGEVNQIQDAGIPILAKLAEHYGVSTAEMSKMVSQGKVDAETFNEVLQGTVGGAALEMGNTFSGAMGNIQAALGRLGASVLSGVFAQMPGLIGGATAALDKLGPAAEKVGKWLGDALTNAVTRIRNAFGKIDTKKLEAAFDKVRAVAKTLWEQVQNDLLPALTDLWNMFQRNLQPIIEKVATKVSGLAIAIGVSLIPIVSGIIGKIVEWEDVLVPLAAGVAAVVAAIKIWKTTIVVITGAKKAWAAVQAALNAVMMMNPIALVTLAIIAFIAIVVVAWQRSDKFREVVTNAWDKIKSATGTAFNWVKNKIETVWNFLKNLFLNFTGPGLVIKHWDTIKDATKTAFNWVKNKVKEVWDFIKNLFLNWTGPGLVIKHWDTIKTTFSDGVDKAADFVMGLPDKIKGFFTGAKDWLVSAGKDVLDGLWNGLKGKWEDVKGWFDNVTDKIPDLKGPAAKDKKLLRGAGSLVMGGFLDGLEAGADAPLKFLSGYSDRVTDAFTATNRDARGVFDAHVSAENRVRFDIHLTADSVDQLRRGREIQQDLDAFAASGGRRRAL